MSNVPKHLLMNVTEQTTLAEARKFVRDSREFGAECPCCGQIAKIYKRSPYRRIVVALMRLYWLNRQKEGWYYIDSIYGAGDKKGGDFAKLRFWGLVVLKSQSIGDKRTSGLWHITVRGIEFVERKLRIQPNALIYNNECFGFSGEPQLIDHFLGQGFSYARILASAATATDVTATK